ncbi:unnamed protein product, partial [Ectocarpus sp. 12 AP-2014]
YSTERPARQPRGTTTVRVTTSSSVRRGVQLQSRQTTSKIEPLRHVGGFLLYPLKQFSIVRPATIPPCYFACSLRAYTNQIKQNLPLPRARTQPEYFGNPYGCHPQRSTSQWPTNFTFWPWDCAKRLNIQNKGKEFLSRVS